MVRLKDIAEQTGLSVTTVSRVINETAEEIGISAETQEKVWKVARELNYQPNKLARNLRMGRRPRTIVFISSDFRATNDLVPENGFLAHPFFSHLIHGIHMGLSEKGWYLTYFSLNQDNLPQLKMLLEEAVSGVVTFGHIPPEAVKMIQSKKLPVVSLGSHRDGLSSHIIHANNEMAVGQAVDHLVGLGHRRISFAAYRSTSGKDYPAFKERIDVFLKRTSYHGVEAESWLELINRGGLADIDVGFALGRQLLERSQPPTAILGVTDLCAIGVLKAANSMGVSVPEDLSVVGIDDIEWAAHVDPPLTSVRIPKEDMGVQAVRILETIFAGNRDKTGEILVPTELVVRSSSGPVKQG